MILFLQSELVRVVLTGGQNAWDLFRHEKAKRRIITSCHDLDNILGGGICTKEVTEICKFLCLFSLYGVLYCCNLLKIGNYLCL